MIRGNLDASDMLSFDWYGFGVRSLDGPQVFEPQVIVQVQERDLILYVDFGTLLSLSGRDQVGFVHTVRVQTVSECLYNSREATTHLSRNGKLLSGAGKYTYPSLRPVIGQRFLASGRNFGGYPFPLEFPRLVHQMQGLRPGLWHTSRDIGIPKETDIHQSSGQMPGILA